MYKQWILDSIQKPVLRCRALFICLALASHACSENGVANEPMPASMRALVLESLQNNTALHAREFDLQSAQNALIAARAALRPTLALSARYTRSDGGRTIEFPIGDALNPAYQTLNRLTAGSAQPSAFSTINNQQFSLLRAREQESRLQFQGVLYSPEVQAAIDAAKASVLQKQAAKEVFARTLARDVQLAYYQLAQSDAGVKTLAASKIVLKENLRVNDALFQSGSATRDRPLRAQAELLGIEDRLLSATAARRNARRYLNFLLGRPLADRDIRLSALRVEVLEPGDIARAPLPQKPRPELSELQANIAALTASDAQQRARLKPSVSYAVDGGIQGQNYGFGSGKNFATASVVLNWRLLDFGQSRARRSAIAEQTKSLQAVMSNLRSAFELASLQARAELKSAVSRTSTAQARLDAAQESYRISAKKRDAGALPQVEYLDSERAQTEARLALDAARFEQARRYVEWEFATAGFALPSAWAADSATTGQ